MALKPIDEITERFGTIEPFSESDAEIRRSIAGHFSLVQLAQGEVLVRQGEDADSMFVLLNGELSVAIKLDTNESREITHLMPGAIVGEMALIAGSKRSATVNAVSQCILAKLTIPAFDALLNQRPRIALRLSELSSLRLRSNRLITQLAKFLNSNDPELLSAVEDSVEWITLQKGEHLFRQGDSSEAAYIVVSGRLYVTQLNNRDEEHFVREVDPGDMVGATDLLLETERTNTVYAVRDTELARLSFSHIGALTDRFPKTALGLMRMVLRRNSSTVKILKKENTPRISIALVPLDTGLDMEAIQSA